MNTKMLLIINALSFQIVWWLGVLYANAFIVIAVLLIGLHFLLAPQPRLDIKVMLIAAALGIAIDSALMLSGVFVFSIPPVWLVLLWYVFGLSLNHSLAFLGRLPIWLQSGVGGISGAMSYLAGERFNAVSFGFDYMLTSLLLVLIWSLLLPVLVYIASKLSAQYSGGYHANKPCKAKT